MKCTVALLLLLACSLPPAIFASLDGIDVSQQDFNVPNKTYSEVIAEDFAFRGFKNWDSTALYGALSAEAKAQSPGGINIGLNQQTMPILNFAGISSALLIIKKNGQVPPHLHPRANSLLTVIKGGPLRLEITDSNNKKFVIRLQTGDVGFIPKGLIHVMENEGSKEVLAMHQFNSGYAGTVRVVPALMASSASVLDTAFNHALSDADISSLKAGYITGYPLQTGPEAKRAP